MARRSIGRRARAVGTHGVKPRGAKRSTRGAVIGCGCAVAYKTRAGETQHAARERIAREKGFRSYREYRGAGVQRRRQSTAALAARDTGYRARARGVLNTIDTRRRQDVQTTEGRVVTTSSVRRMRALVREAERDGSTIHVTVAAEVGGIDRRRTDARRHHGRDTGVRTVRFTIEPGELDTSSLDDFYDALGDAIDDATDDMYAGGGGGGVPAAVGAFSFVIT